MRGNLGKHGGLILETVQGFIDGNHDGVKTSCGPVTHTHRGDVDQVEMYVTCDSEVYCVTVERAPWLT